MKPNDSSERSPGLLLMVHHAGQRGCFQGLPAQHCSRHSYVRLERVTVYTARYSCPLKHSHAPVCACIKAELHPQPYTLKSPQGGCSSTPSSPPGYATDGAANHPHTMRALHALPRSAPLHTRLPLERLHTRYI